MTNFEKWKDELKKLVRKNNGIAIVGGEPVECEADTVCEDCLFFWTADNGYCPADIDRYAIEYTKWLLEEYKEKPRLTKRQRAFCEAVGSGWLVRSFSGNVLNFYVNKPKRVDSEDYPYWTTHDDYYFTVNNYLPKFEFIKWKDEPYSIEEMLKWEIEE